MKGDEVYAHMFVYNLAGENKIKSVVNDDEIFMGSTKGKRRQYIVPWNGFKVRMHVVNKKKNKSFRDNHTHEAVTPLKMSLIRREWHVITTQRNIMYILYIWGVPPSQQINSFSILQGRSEHVSLWCITC